MAKARGTRKKKEVVETEAQVKEPPVAKAPTPTTAPLTAEERELAAIRDRCVAQTAEEEAAYNRDVLPGKIAKLKEALKKLPKKCSTEELLKAAFEAMNDGDPNVAAW